MVLTWNPSLKIGRTALIMAPNGPRKSFAAKYRAVEGSWRVVDLGLEVIGGHGIFRSAGYERLFRDARLGRIHPANSFLTREVVAKTALGISLTNSRAGVERELQARNSLPSNGFGPNLFIRARLYQLCGKLHFIAGTRDRTLRGGRESHPQSRDYQPICCIRSKMSSL